MRCTVTYFDSKEDEGADSLSFPTDDADLHPKLGLSFLPLGSLEKLDANPHTGKI